MSLLNAILDTLYSAVACCLPEANISINGRAYRIIKLLGEGGFSFVYLAEDGSGNEYALKKIRCTLGTKEATLAQREVDMYRLFEHKNIIRMLDSATITEPDDSKTIYIFLPYYKRGNLQDAISKNQLHRTHFPESYMLKVFRDVCEAVKYMHTFKMPMGGRRRYPENAQHPMQAADDADHRQDRALLSGHHSEESSQLETQVPGKEGQVVPWAHRDIKPGNVLMSDDGETPILMDFGSACPARIEIHNRQEALAQQDLAAEHCSMPYRAPELFDVKTETVLDEKVDIWSLGCTLYAMAYGQSPFEASMNEQGGSIALAVLNGQFKFPSNPELANLYSPAVKELISFMLVSDPKARPDIHQVISKIDSVLQQSGSQGNTTS